MEEQNDKPVIIAVDAGSRRLGLCAAYGDRYISSWQETVHGDPVGVRIASIARIFQRLITRYQPAVIALEEPMGDHCNRHTDRVLGRVCGAIEAVVALLPDKSPPVRILWINPQSVKQTGFCKDNPLAAAYLVGKQEVGPDEADAIGIWQAALCRLQVEAFASASSDQSRITLR